MHELLAKILLGSVVLLSIFAIIYLTLKFLSFLLKRMSLGNVFALLMFAVVVYLSYAIGDLLY